MSLLLKAEAMSILPARRYCQSQPWIWSCSVAGSLLMFSVWYLGPIPISKGGPPGALTFWSAWRLSRPPACGISCQWEQTTPLLQNIHPPPFILPTSLPFTIPPPSMKLPGAPLVLTGSRAEIPFPNVLTVMGEVLEMLTKDAGRLAQPSGQFRIYEKPQCQYVMETDVLSEGLRSAIVRPHCELHPSQCKWH